MEKISKIVEQKVRRMGEGKVFALEDILPENSTKAEYFRTVKTLSKLQKLQRVFRVRKGLYFTPEKLFLTDRIITFATSHELENYYYKKFKGKMYVAGAPLYNGMGLTEQVSQSSFYAVETPPKDFEFQRLFFVKAKCAITERNKMFLQILDCIEQIDKVSAKKAEDVVDRLSYVIPNKVDEKDYVELIRYSKYYAPQVRAILAAIFATIGKENLAMELKETYSAGSRFKIKFTNSKVLTNKKNYGIYNAYEN